MIELTFEEWEIVDLLARIRWKNNRENKHVSNFRNFQPHMDFDEIERRGIAGEMAFAKHVGIWFPTSQDPAVRVNEPDLFFGGKTIDVKTSWKRRNLNLTMKEWDDHHSEAYVLMYFYESTLHFEYVGYAMREHLVQPYNARRGVVFDGQQAPDYWQLTESQLNKSLP